MFAEVRGPALGFSWDWAMLESCAELSTCLPPRCVLFNPDGCCLYSGFQDSLRVYGWEPERCFDVVLVNWGRVADLSICNNQLVSNYSWGGGKVAVKHEIKSSCLYAGFLTLKLISDDKWPGLATCPALREILCSFAFSSTMLAFSLFGFWRKELGLGLTSI